MKEKEKINSEDKMKKKFRKYRNIMSVIEGVMLVLPVIIIIAIIISVCMSKISGKDKLNLTSDSSNFDNTENFDLKTELINILGITDKLENDDNFQNASETLKNLMINSAIIAKLIAYVLSIIIVDNIVKMFGEIVKQGTPFTENNIKWLKIINVAATILWALYFNIFSIGLIFVIVISAFRTVFEYGYKLQIESDETL